ncbi:zinc ribbon domain-containing protein, partial [Halorubrum ezzemoulense]
STLPGYANGYRPGVASQTAMDFLEDIATRPSNRLCVKCLSLLDGGETFCPDCGREFP